MKPVANSHTNMFIVGHTYSTEINTDFPDDDVDDVDGATFIVTIRSIHPCHPFDLSEDCPHRNRDPNAPCEGILEDMDGRTYCGIPTAFRRFGHYHPLI